ncbi:MAG TPA: hypothetical protein VFM54_02510 [Micromonosporaceae bacterium]|nr:hypothetical protein [Micromonosporaceae bacterium]
MPDDAAAAARPRKRKPERSVPPEPDEAGPPSELVVREDFVSWLEAEYQRARRKAEER